MTARSRFFSLVLAASALAGWHTHLRADEPGVLAESRWKALSEVEFAELKAAEDLFRRKEYKAARNSYEKFATVHAKADVGSYCRLMMAECVRLYDKPNVAVSDFQLVRDLAPDSSDAKWAYIRIGQCYRAAGEFEKATLVFKDIFQGEGKSELAFKAGMLWLEILEGQQKWADRVPVWETIIERFQKDRFDRDQFAGVANSLARFRLWNANVDAALQLIRMTNGKKGAGPEDRLVEMAQGVIRDMGKSVATDPSLKDRREKLAAAMAQKAMQLLNEERKRPGYQSLAGAVIGILESVDRTDDAIKQALEIKKFYDNDQWTYGLVTSLFKRLKKLDEAIGQASEARKIHKDADWSLDLYAGLVMEKGDVESAIQVWDRMKDRKYALTVTSEAVLELGKLDEALARRHKILELDPQATVDVYMWTGKALAKAKKFDKAIEEYRLAQNEPKNLYSVAETYSAWGKHKDSIAQYEEIGAAFEKERPNAVYCIALEHEKLGDKDRAILLMRRVCRTWPKTKAASQAHVRLQSKYNIDETLGGEPGEQKPD